MLVGLLSGIYPALVLSGFRPASVLRGGGRQTGGGQGRLRMALVICQFAVSIGLGIATLVIFSQINHARTLDLGLRRDRTLLVYTAMLATGTRESFRQQLLREPAIEGVAEANDFPFSTNEGLWIVKRPGRAQRQLLVSMDISPSFRALYGIRLLAGRDLSRDRPLDAFSETLVVGKNGGPNQGRSVMVNALGAAQLGWTAQQAVNQSVEVNGERLVIIGVVADAKFKGAREPVRPMIYYYDSYFAQTLSVRVRAGMMQQATAAIDRLWHAFAPNNAVSRNFLDDKFADQFRQDETQGALFGLFVGIAIFIACLGLFGLAAFTAGRRTREIGIRKVFGATTREVTVLMLWQFSVPVLIANLIAWPVAWWYLRGWLDGYAYRIALSPLYFVEVGLAALAIAWATMLAHTLQVARASPIRALRHE